MRLLLEGIEITPGKLGCLVGDQNHVGFWKKAMPKEKRRELSAVMYTEWNKAVVDCKGDLDAACVKFFKDMMETITKLWGESTSSDYEGVFHMTGRIQAVLGFLTDMYAVVDFGEVGGLR